MNFNRKIKKGMSREKLKNYLMHINPITTLTMLKTGNKTDLQSFLMAEPNIEMTDFKCR